MLKIGDFSRLSRMSVRMLRHYDELGLLTPLHTDPASGYRYYSPAQLSRANRIRAFRDMGFGLQSIGLLLQQGDDKDAIRAQLYAQRAALQTQLETTSRQLRLLEGALSQLRKDDFSMQYNVTLKQLPAMPVASVRGQLPSYAEEGRLWHLLMEETAAHLSPAQPCYSLAIFHDREFKESQVDVEIQMTVKQLSPDTEHIKFKMTEPVQFASAIFQGGYEKIGEVNQAVAHGVEENGYAFAGSMFNIYHVGPHQTQDPADYVTEVCYPVQK